MSSSDEEFPRELLLADAEVERERLREFAQRIIDMPEGEPVPQELLQQGFTAMTRLYAVRYQLGERWPPFTDPETVPATAAMIMATAMMRNVNVELFELGMWQSFSGV